MQTFFKIPCICLGLEAAAVKAQEPDDGPGKRMKLKGRRQVDTALRRSVEQRIEQLHGMHHILI